LIRPLLFGDSTVKKYRLSNPAHARIASNGAWCVASRARAPRTVWLQKEGVLFLFQMSEWIEGDSRSQPVGIDCNKGDIRHCQKEKRRMRETRGLTSQDFQGKECIQRSQICSTLNYTPQLDWQKHPFVIDSPGQNGTVHCEANWRREQKFSWTSSNHWGKIKQQGGMTCHGLEFSKCQSKLWHCSALHFDSIFLLMSVVWFPVVSGVLPQLCWSLRWSAFHLVVTKNLTNSPTCNTLICLWLAMHRASSYGTHRVVTHSRKTRFSAHRTSCH